MVFSADPLTTDRLRGIIEWAACIRISGFFQGFTENFIIRITKEVAYLNDVIIMESEE